jgi:hypothetical protein
MAREQPVELLGLSLKRIWGLRQEIARGLSDNSIS